MTTPLNKLSLVQAAQAIKSGRISSEQLVSTCLEHITARESQVGAWVYLNPDYALQQAREADRRQASGEPLGPLHGVPLGIKDIFDTRDMPCENGTVLHQGRQPAEDARVISLLRQAGAVMLGKTVTAELAVYTPGKTKNPHDPARTPGGSSSGSAAAVADHMVPGALGTQTNGSMIRPASFCGVVGFKPSYGRISRYGVLSQCPSLDQVGVFARSLADAALLVQCIMDFDAQDAAMQCQAVPDLLTAAQKNPAGQPKLALVKSPVWDQAEPEAQKVFLDYAHGLGGMVEELTLPSLFDEAVATHASIMLSEMATSYEPLYRKEKKAISPKLGSMIEQGLDIKARDYIQARRRQPEMTATMQKAMQGYDAIITLPATGEAPVGLYSTGNPIFCTIWTLCGMPSVSLPLLKGAAGMPIGVQVVTRPGEDARLMAIAAQLAA